jgi:hypothetical protein
VMKASRTGIEGKLNKSSISAGAVERTNEMTFAISSVGHLDATKSRLHSMMAWGEEAEKLLVVGEAV